MSRSSSPASSSWTHTHAQAHTLSTAEGRPSTKGKNRKLYDIVQFADISSDRQSKQFPPPQIEYRDAGNLGMLTTPVPFIEGGWQGLPIPWSLYLSFWQCSLCSQRSPSHFVRRRALPLVTSTWHEHYHTNRWVPTSHIRQDQHFCFTINVLAAQVRVLCMCLCFPTLKVWIKWRWINVLD